MKLKDAVNAADQCKDHARRAKHERNVAVEQQFLRNKRQILKSLRR